MKPIVTLCFILCLLANGPSHAQSVADSSPLPKLEGEDGYELWLRYRKIENPQLLASYRKAIPHVSLLGEGATRKAILEELKRSLPVMLDQEIAYADGIAANQGLVIGTFEKLKQVHFSLASAEQASLGKEGYVIRRQHVAGRDLLIVGGNTQVATLYGTFALLRQMQTRQDIDTINQTSVPKIQRRVLNHWDDLDGEVERGYAGRSLWKWDELPGKISPRYINYGRACASIGINGMAVNNVNASELSLSSEYLIKTAALADTLRPYGIKVMLCPLFSAPIKLGKLRTADPRDREVVKWWSDKISEIYHLIPDFGGFLVKANSEGQPGPQTYGATHAQGADMMAKLLRPHGGIVSWRAFVYNTEKRGDRASSAYEEFVPNDGKFAPNAFLQVKNGPIDFQAREPFHPIFGAMPKTHLALELQITKEYLGQSTHLVYLAPMWKEVLDSDTHAMGSGSTVAKVVDGTLEGHQVSLIAGVANTGDERNWCGHHFDQANWYAYGRLAWDHQLKSEDIARDWIRSTWSQDLDVIRTIEQIMMSSHENCVNYMIPLGLNGLFDRQHYGPAPGLVNLTKGRRRDWTNQYYHNMSEKGVGFNRSSTGSNNARLYSDPLGKQFGDPETCPEKFLLWFHHVPWTHRMKSGRTLWEELQLKYAQGVAGCDTLRSEWKMLENRLDPVRHRHVLERMELQAANARKWQQTCLDAFREHAEK